jgi:hypothetical protein
VKFRLDTSAGQVIPSKWTSALARSGAVRLTFTGPSIAPVKASCSFTSATRQFSCTIKIPHGTKIGKAHAYRITAQQNPGNGFVTIAASARTPNPETIYFK